MKTLSAAQSDPGDVESYSYDANGNRLTLSKRDGSGHLSWAYDALNREIDHYLHTIGAYAATPPAISGNDVATTYDLAGRKLSALFSSGSGVTYAYDAAGRPISEATNGLAMSYGYDASSNRTQMTWPDSVYVSYAYDGLNRVSQVQENGATSGVGLLAQFGYDALSRRTSATLGNGAATAYAYDADSHLISLGHSLRVSSYNVTFGTFTYNPAHQILARPSSNTAYDFGGYANGTSRASTANGLN